MIGTGVIVALAVVLAMAGATKVRRPDPFRRAMAALGVRIGARPARAVGVGELALAALALTLPARLSGGALAGVFALFAIVAGLLGRAGSEAGCGCFGDAGGRAPGLGHVVLAVLAAFAAAGVAALAPRSPLALAASRPHAALAPFVAACLAATLWRRALSARGRPAQDAFALAQAAPRAPTRRSGRAGEDPGSAAVAADARLSERLVGASAHFLEQRFSRRSALVRIAVAGSALSVAPLRYLLYPQPALAVLVPGDCAQGDCTDGYTAFCCEINDGVNECPPGTFAGGWWMCTDYRGRQLCSGRGVRYYVDCNAIPGRPFPGGCRCANGTCEERRMNCNVFRYGQCNTHVAGVTPVVCRMVTCQNPGSIPHLNCSSSVAVDDAVCGHEAPCLEPPAAQPLGAGGV